MYFFYNRAEYDYYKYHPMEEVSSYFPVWKKIYS